MKPKYSRFIKWSLIIGIVIVLNLFFNYTLSLVYKEPQFDQFCKITQVIEPIQSKTACLNVGGQWNENTAPIEKTPGVTTPVSKGYCDEQFTCRTNYDTAQKGFTRNVFATLVVLGVLCIIISMFLKKNDVVMISLSLGGVLSLIIASVRYWSSADNLVKVIILAIALIALVFVALKKFRDQDETVRS